MVLSIDTVKESIGSMKLWIRATSSVTLPSGWLICDGSTVADSASPFNGVALPDFRTKHPRGHSTITNATFGTATTYVLGGAGVETGGAASVNLNHAHNISGDGSHNHTVNAHNHGISTDGSHGHNASTGGSEFFVFINALGFIVSNGSHSHGSVTGSSSPGTDFQGNHNHGGGTGSNLGSVSTVPPYLGFVYIIKIK